MLDEDGGVIRTRAAIGALVAALGGALVRDEAIEVRANGEVRAAGSIRRFDRVVVCAGRDTPALAGGLDIPLRVSTHTRFTYRGPADLPCLLDPPHRRPHLLGDRAVLGPRRVRGLESGALVFAAGNNLFKHAPALGRELAGAALGEGLREELRPAARLASGR